MDVPWRRGSGLSMDIHRRAEMRQFMKRLGYPMISLFDLFLIPTYCDIRAGLVLVYRFKGLYNRIGHSR